MSKAMTLTIAVVATFAGASFIVAQSGPLKVASGHRELCYRRPNRGTASRTHTILRASRSSQRSS